MPKKEISSEDGVTIDVATVRQLLETQYPEYANELIDTLTTTPLSRRVITSSGHVKPIEEDIRSEDHNHIHF